MLRPCRSPKRSYWQFEDPIITVSGPPRVGNLEIEHIALCRSEEFKTLERLRVETLAKYPPCALRLLGIANLIAFPRRSLAITPCESHLFCWDSGQ
ncbi:hypothetical protein PITC_055170 [Penicillium italicum]|uniref:Uncharacterized protein n=1 Tax=Penicillium italicum TaxID=40296 RepID=A0A0A2L6P5_PENIT|nr:hypothetical protein PITC_055170 [Penicillium italicum]